jgi:uncharacterized protein
MFGDGEAVATLEEAECFDLLGRSSIGRVAVSIGAVPAVFPVNFAMLDGTIVFRTSTGTKLDAAMRNSVIAFEVDEFETLYHDGWSVLVVGIADEMLDPALVERAEHLPLAAWAEGSREHVVVVRPEFVSGRRIVHGSRSAPTGTGG